MTHIRTRGPASGPPSYSAFQRLYLIPAPIQERWNSCIPPDTQPAAGKLNTVALSQLMGQCGISGRKWIDQFAFGFPITSALSQKHTFELTEPDHDLIARSDLYRSAAHRFRDFASRSGFKNGSALWGEATTQHKHGWRGAPIPLNADGRPTTWRSKRYNIAFRCGVDHAEKLRACDDLRHSLTNLACRVKAPIHLVSWGHISQISQLVNNGAGDWELFISDHEAACKLPPLNPDDQDASIIAPMSPRDQLWYGGPSRTLVFGSIAAVIHYNVFSRLTTDLVNQLFGTPLVSFSTISQL